MPIVEVCNLTKKYFQGETEVFAANNVSFTIEKGEFVSISGQSGSGKTTILNLIGGIDTPTSGTIMIDGEDIYAVDNEALAKIRRQKIGFVFQGFNLIPILSAKENIVMPLLLDQKSVDENHLKEITEVLGITTRLQHLPSELSGGQQQRVAIARALINKPSIILADEPTGNLDKANSDEIMCLFKKLNDMGNTIILVTHDEKYAKLSTRNLNICDGKIVNN